ncbi:MAG: hypothetical protein PSX81_09720 [bacterium]|nr:hypothetical protein [bacterium]
MKEALIAIHTVIYNVKGIKLPQDIIDLEIYKNGENVAFLTNDIVKLAEDVEKNEAISNFILRKTFNNWKNR